MTRPSLMIAAAVLAGAAPVAGRTETLQEAIAAAYRTNPVLQGQRAQQRALDETVVQARTGWRPSVGLTAQAAYQRVPDSLANTALGSSAANDGSAALTLSQPLYTGGRTTWAVRAAEDQVGSGRETLRAVEAQVLLGVVQAYLDVRRDQEGLAIRDADVATLARQVAEAGAKFKLGQITRTDVAQAEAQLEAARGAVAAATGQLAASAAEFEAAVGEAPRDLAETGDLPGLPASLDAALGLATASNPQLLQSRLQERASRDAVAEARSAYRPTIALQASYGYVGSIPTSSLRDYAQQTSVGVVLSLPLLTGGLTASQVRQAAAQDTGAQFTIETTRRQVVQAAAQSWSQLSAARQEAVAGRAQEQAADLALRGVQLEYGYGLRTTLDVLIADENLRAAQLSLAAARHDAGLAQASVLSVTGRLEARYLVPAEPLYDPRANFDRVQHADRPPYEGLIQAVDKLGAPSAQPP